MAGSGSDIEDVNEIKYLADKCKFKVIFHGKLNHSQLSELFNKSDIFILPSFYEGLPVVVLEAMACGCDVIVSEVNGLGDFMGDEVNQSGNISYVKLSKMKSVGKPFKNELPLFEENISKSIGNFIEKTPKHYSSINIRNKTWNGLALKVDKIMKDLM
ncbi:glycosyltransferase family 4 protein [Terrisporobacter sp.]